MCNTFTLQQPPTLYNTSLGPQSIVSADFNQDNHLDLAITNYNANSVSILLGIGNGSFLTPSMNVSLVELIHIGLLLAISIMMEILI